MFIGWNKGKLEEMEYLNKLYISIFYEKIKINK